ncbi:biotin/lipoyl-containing protein [Marinicellulosiphila megalodicopiae]|uniref:biotin/lipoyl-containing protein n=1 Tax=Marinicellulosiphila megalodicopiae TaxID=2724896 RepID=UPI003BAE1B0E
MNVKNKKTGLGNLFQKDKKMVTLKVGQTNNPDSEYVITKIYVDDGATLNKDDPVFEVESDKAIFDIYAPADGKIATLSVKEGESISEIQILAFYEVFDESQLSGKAISKKSDPVASKPIVASKKENKAPDKKYTIDAKIASSATTSTSTSTLNSNSNSKSKPTQEKKSKQNKVGEKETSSLQISKSKDSKRNNQSSLNKKTKKETDSNLPFILLGFFMGSIFGALVTSFLLLLK